MKRKTTKELLAESFRELAETKTIDKITIQEIVENCDYSIATFYRHFKDKYELIAWDYTQGVAAILARIGEGDYTWDQALTDALTDFEKKREYLANLFLHTSGHDSFVRYMRDINCGLLEKHILENAGEKELSPELGLYVRVYCLGTVDLICEWILGRHSLEPEELARICKNALPLPLHAYLTK